MGDTPVPALDDFTKAVLAFKEKTIADRELELESAIRTVDQTRSFESVLNLCAASRSVWNAIQSLIEERPEEVTHRTISRSVALFDRAVKTTWRFVSDGVYEDSLGKITIPEDEQRQLVVKYRVSILGRRDSLVQLNR